MTASTLDTLARGARPSRGRRNALKAFGAAALAGAIGAPLATEAKKKGKTKKRKKQGGTDIQECPICPAEDCTQEAEQAAAEQCTSQVATCEQEVRKICDRNNNDQDGEAECLDEFLPCCQALGACDVTAFFACIAPEPEENL